MLDNAGVEELRGAVVLQATRDCRRWNKKYYKENSKLKPDKRRILDLERKLNECERSLKSEWFSFLTGLDGNEIIENVQKELNCEF